LNKLLRQREAAIELFHRTGRALCQYHELAQKAFSHEAVDLRECDSMKELLKGKKGSVVEAALNRIPPKNTGVIFKDFTPSNVVINDSGQIYFIDIQEQFYRAPLAYDWARFMDTLRIFGLVRKPSMLRFFSLIRQAEEAFLRGYGGTRDLYFKDIQYVHRMEHVHIKITKTPLRGVILKLLYAMV